jgi:hypothetical protein
MAMLKGDRPTRSRKEKSALRDDQTKIAENRNEKSNEKSVLWGLSTVSIPKTSERSLSRSGSRCKVRMPAVGLVAQRHAGSNVGSKLICQAAIAL